MPTSGKVKQELFNLLHRENIRGNIVELGAGWGSLAFPVARQYKNCNVNAYENSPVPYMFCRFLNLFFLYTNLKFYLENFYTISLTDTNVLLCYICPDAMGKLKAKFESELKEKTLIVCHTFAVPGWKPCRQIEVGDMYRTKIYVYEKGRNL